MNCEDMEGNPPCVPLSNVSIRQQAELGAGSEVLTVL